MSQKPTNIKEILNLAINEVQHAYQVELNIENILYYAQDIIEESGVETNTKKVFWTKLLKIQAII